MPGAIAALVHNDAMEPSIEQGSIVIASPSLRSKRWSVIGYRSALTIEHVCEIAKRESGFFSKLTASELSVYYSNHFDVFGPVRINRIARVVGLEGETVELSDRGLEIDGRAASPPQELSRLYVAPPKSAFFKSEVIPAGHVYVMKDNLKRTQDSRTFGPINVMSILGTLSDNLGTGRQALEKLTPELRADLIEQHGAPEMWSKPN